MFIMLEGLGRGIVSNVFSLYLILVILLSAEICRLGMGPLGGAGTTSPCDTSISYMLVCVQRCECYTARVGGTVAGTLVGRRMVVW